MIILLPGIWRKSDKLKAAAFVAFAVLGIATLGGKIRRTEFYVGASDTEEKSGKKRSGRNEKNNEAVQPKAENPQTEESDTEEADADGGGKGADVAKENKKGGNLSAFFFPSLEGRFFKTLAITCIIIWCNLS